MEKETIIELKNIRKEFPGVVALDNVNMKIRSSEVHALVGENGAGKSTLMNNTVIDRYGSDHSRALVSQLLAEWLGITVAGKIHNCFCTEINGTHNFLHFNIIIFAVAGNA